MRDDVMERRSFHGLQSAERVTAEVASLSGTRKRGEGGVESYAGLPYHLLVVRDNDDNGRPWTASVEELPGCTAHGKSAEEALEAVEEIMAKWISVALEEGREIPEPRSAASHSGRLLLRMPKTLHADLTRASEREGVSLNQFITDVLAAAVEWRAGPASTQAAKAQPSINQAPGAEGLTTERGARRRPKQNQSRFTNAALAANFLIVALAAIVAIIVLIAAAT
jgi:predicted RNase H-like HicB family nuclease